MKELPGIFNGSIISTQKFGPREEITSGPIRTGPTKLGAVDPLGQPVAPFQYERNGLVEIHPEKIEFLGS